MFKYFKLGFDYESLGVCSHMHSDLLSTCIYLAIPLSPRAMLFLKRSIKTDFFHISNKIVADLRNLLIKTKIILKAAAAAAAALKKSRGGKSTLV